MKLSHITLQNFRRYEAARFHFHEQFTVLIGNNGKGKTTVLDAVAMMLNTYFQGSRMPTGGGTIAKDDARLIYTEKEGQVFREKQAEVSLKATATVNGVPVSWQRDMGDRGGKAKELVKLGTKAREKVSKGESPDLPLLLYYGAGRLWNLHDNIETEKPSSQLDAYRYCLDPKSDQKAFEKWFKKLAFTTLQKNTQIPATDVVRKAILDCIPGAKDFYHDTEFDELTIQLEKDGLVPFNSLSDGYRNMVGMVADIAHRAARLNPHLGVEAGTRATGVVLIDEIDLHLHPKWQRRVVLDLKKAFPRLQFIASTHSPFILQSLLPGEVIDLDEAATVEAMMLRPLGVASPGPGHAFAGRSIEDIVEKVMGVAVPQRGQRHEDMRRAAVAYFKLLESTKASNPVEKQALKDKLDQLSAPFSDNVAYHAFLQMKRLAAGVTTPEDEQDDSDDEFGEGNAA
jgi:predicted ATP-binding protein involved in virulence